MARYRGLAFADDLLAHHRDAPVGADQGGGFEVCAVGSYKNFLAKYFKTGNLGAGPQLDQLVRAAAVEKGAVDVGAVGHRVGVAEALGEARIQRDVDHAFSADAVHHQQALDDTRFFTSAPTPIASMGARRGRELVPAANLADSLPLEHHHRNPLRASARAAARPAEAAAGDTTGFAFLGSLQHGNRCAAERE